jgi:hypothetical protein
VHQLDRVSPLSSFRFPETKSAHLKLSLLVETALQRFPMFDPKTLRQSKSTPSSGARIGSEHFVILAKECPYCIVTGFQFRPMTRNTSEEYVCTRCGHVEYPALRGLHCGCVQCQYTQASAVEKRP